MIPLTNYHLLRNIMKDQEFFTEKHLAKRWGISHLTIQKWRWRDMGPPYMKLSTKVLYSLENIKKFEDQNTHYPTNQKPLRSKIKQALVGVIAK
jgi:hypothetical protein